MRQYIALIHKDQGSDYGVSFPDLPGCATAGKDLDEARAFAEEALALHLTGLAEDGEAIPEPSSLEAIMADAENRQGVAVVVPVKDAPSRVVRINITMPEDVLARVDAHAERQGMNRSGFLAYAAKWEMDAVNDLAKLAQPGNKFDPHRVDALADSYLVRGRSGYGVWDRRQALAKAVANVAPDGEMRNLVVDRIANFAPMTADD